MDGARNATTAQGESSHSAPHIRAPLSSLLARAHALVSSCYRWSFNTALAVTETRQLISCLAVNRGERRGEEATQERADTLS